MSPESAAIIVAVIAQLGGTAHVMLQNRKQTRKVETLHTKVEPVSNGFASHVMGALARIEIRLDDHMRGHP